MRLLIIRTSALGDIVHALPVVTALRRQFPTARIGWVVEEAFAPLLAGHPALDALLPVRLRPWRRSPFAVQTWREFRTFLGALRGFGADVVLDLMGNHKSGLLAALAGAERRIGPARGDRREPSSAAWISEEIALRGEHAVARGLSLLAALGVSPAEPDFGGSQILRDEPPEARALLAGLRQPLVLIHPGAAWANKRYPPALWGEVAHRLAGSGYAIRVATAPGEEGLSATVVAASGGGAQSIAAPSLLFLAAFARRARLFLGGDSGPTHLAHALGTPVLCLMGPTDPRRHGPFGHPERALALSLPCSFCRRRFAESKGCLVALPPALVAERALELLGSKTQN